MEMGEAIEDRVSRDVLLLTGVGGRKDLLALPTGRLGPGEEDLRGATAGGWWDLRDATVGVCWTIREMGLSVHVKSEQGGGVTITNCCAWKKKNIAHFTPSSLRGEYFVGQIFTPAQYITLARVSMP